MAQRGPKEWDGKSNLHPINDQGFVLCIVCVCVGRSSYGRQAFRSQGGEEEDEEEDDQGLTLVSHTHRHTHRGGKA